MTNKSECRFVVEMEAFDGYRAWSGSMPEDAVNNYISFQEEYGLGLSDVDHAGECMGTCSDPL